MEMLGGTQQALAKAVGVTQQTVSETLSRETVPAKWAIRLEKATKGRVTRHQLRPDLYPDDQSNDRGSRNGAAA